MKTTEIIKDQIIVLNLELDELRESKKIPMIKSVDYQALCSREREINTEKNILEKQLVSPMSVKDVELKIKNKTTASVKLNIQKKKYEPSGFADLLEQIGRVNVELSTFEWIIT